MQQSLIDTLSKFILLLFGFMITELSSIHLSSMTVHWTQIIGMYDMLSFKSVL